MTNQLDHLSPPAQAFLNTVRGRLDDLTTSDQADLLDQVEQRLHDLDTSGGPDAIDTHLGKPADLADEIRAAAGFPPAAATTETVRSTSSIDALRALTAHRTMRPVVNYLVSLRPAWWAARGYILIAGVLAAISQGGGYRLHTLGSYTQAFGGRDDTAMVHLSRTWILIPLAAVVASVALGLATARLPRTARVLVAALNVIAIALFLAYPTWWLAPAFAYYTGLVT